MVNNLPSGPAPSANRRRRNATTPMTPLPAGGRKGALPKWPLAADIVTRARLQVAADKVADLEWKLEEGKPVASQLTRAQEKLAELQQVVAIQADAELVMWRELWKTPQAAEWERGSYHREVAQYVRWKVLGESGDLDAAKEARQFADRLGLTPLAMLRLRWEIVDDQQSRQAPLPSSPPPGPATVTDISRRQRLSG